MKKNSRYVRNACVEKDLIERIQENFLNEEFFARLLKLINSREGQETQLFERILEFSRECYIHGVTAGISAAIEIYEDS